MPKLVGKSSTVVNHDGLTIDELAGNVATSDDSLSIAYVTVSKPTAEPWLTLDYDEWICVKKGLIELHYQEPVSGEETVLELKAGDTAFISKGERFRPVFPKGDTEYVPVCLPAFRPDRCLREEEDQSNGITKRLRELHGMNKDTADLKSSPDTVGMSCSAPVDEATKDVLYHMCQKKLWEKAVQSGEAYYPPTFEADGYFTHATAVPLRLIDTANHFYTNTEGEWICLQLSRSALAKVGIVTKDEGGLPVGDKAVANDWIESRWICPHIYGGLPTLESLGILTEVFPMVRDENGKFLSIAGLTFDE